MALRSEIRRRIVTSAPGRQLISGSKKVYLPGFYGFSVYEVWRPFIQQLRKTSLTERAGGISFNIVMAIPPMLIFAFTLIPLLPISKQFIQELFALIRDIVPGEKNNSVIINFLNDFLNSPRNGLLSFGLLLAIYFSSNAMMGILRAFDKNYPGFMRRNVFERRMVALQLTLIVFVLITVCIGLLIAQSSVLHRLGIQSGFWHYILENFRWILIFMLLFFIVSFIYRHGAAVTKRWPFFTPGAAFATSLMIIATALVSYWVNNFSNYNKLYGSISAIFILMSLIYANSLAVLMGFELNVTLSHLKQMKEESKKIITTP
ncbi:MAG TPA: YihY/virulence factor BrkB family protein [Flavisolibacter sp.]|nr:YihY/virulence factor BrkB family protein [Flavisolibacter sp.]